MKMVYIITLAFIIFDFVSGYVAAIKNEDVSSKVMREGLFHKAGLVMLMVLAAVIEYGQAYIFDSAPIPIIIPACGYICIMEITSILENITKLNPDILPEKIAMIFGKFTEKED